MAEIVGLVASIVAIVEIAHKVIGLCKFYIETSRDAPADLRAILIETSAMASILENVQFLIKCEQDDDSRSSEMLSGLSGPIKGYQDAMSQMAKLFPAGATDRLTAQSNQTKTTKIESAVTYLAWPLKESKAKKLLVEMSRYKATISLALTTESVYETKFIKDKVSKVHELLTTSQRQDMCKWYQTTDPSPIHHRLCSQYEPKTGDWMLQSPEWSEWMEGKNRCLWIYGIPGAGKSVLVSHLIKSIDETCEKAEDKRIAHVYYYCYFGHNQDEAGPLLGWMIGQLTRQAELVPHFVYKLYSQGMEPSIVDLLTALEAVLEYFDTVYVVVDAIDESTPRYDLLRIIRDLATDVRFEKIHLLATSRQYIDIEKVMEGISVSISMLNPLLDADIKLYIESQFTTNPKFKLWPQSLREEATDALSKKAEGMFRWAACQMDTLQRLRPDGEVVRNALRNLPRTLEETYERIFAAIPEEVQDFVHHAMQWIYYHRKLFKFNIPYSILLQGITKSTKKLLETQDYYFDEEVLRELCGCLISVMPEKVDEKQEAPQRIRAVSFAHYTVFEFLTFDRIATKPFKMFQVFPNQINVDFTEIIVLEALNTETTHAWDLRPEPKLGDYVEKLAEDFKIYSILSSFNSLTIFSAERAEWEGIQLLFFKLLDPWQPHFGGFMTVQTHLKDYYKMFSQDIAPFYIGLHITQAMQRRLNPEAAILINLVNSGCIGLAKRFVETVDLTSLLETPLENVKFDAKAKIMSESEEYVFSGSIIECFAQFRQSRILQFVLDLETPFDASKVLVSYVASHDHKYFCRTGCLLSRLLERGALPNAPGYKVSPLQIAAAIRDFEGVVALLEAGADPNNTGSVGGIEWGDDSILGKFNYLAGTSTLQICSQEQQIHIPGSSRKEEDTGPARSKIEEILLQYGATRETGHDFPIAHRKRDTEEAVIGMI